MQDILLYHVLPIVLLVYLGFGAILFIFQRHFIFYPTGPEFSNCPALAEATPITYDSTRAYLKKAGRTVVVLYHGNAETACSRAWYAKEFFEPLGLSYLLVEYTGFAGDTTPPSAEGLYQNARDTVAFLREQPFSRTIIMAESIGGAPAAYHAHLSEEADALILTSPFTALTSVAQRHYPVYPVSLLLRERLETTGWLQETNAAVHLLHGTEDTLVPLEESRLLYQALTTPNKSLTPISGVGHNDIYTSGRWQEEIRSLLQRHASR